MSFLDDHPGQPKETRHSRNEKRIADPRPGDFWHEMFCPYFVVVAVHGEQILICDAIVDLDKDHWTFDLTRCRYATKQALRNRVTYDTMPDKFVADCSAKPHDWVVKEYAELPREPTFADLYATS